MNLLRSSGSAFMRSDDDAGVFRAIDTATDQFTLDQMDDWDTPWTIDGEDITGVTVVRTSVDAVRPRSPILRVLVWLCGSTLPDDDDPGVRLRMPQRKVAVD